MRKSVIALLGLLAFSTPGCGGEETARPPESGAGSTATAPAPSSFSETRAAILAAVDRGEYAALRPLIDESVFLSDFGFGEEPDPVARWEGMGPRPLETMGAILRMKHIVRKTNEGTLHQWPTYDADSDPGDITSEDARLFGSVFSQEELERLITDEYGYTGPRLGILADGTWWFFLLEPGP